MRKQNSSEGVRVGLARILWAGWLGVLTLLGVVPLRADPVLDWHTLMLDAIRADNSGPTLSTRNLAILGLTLSDTINAFHRAYQPRVVLLDPAPGVREDVAAAAAGHFVLTQLYPGFRARADALFTRSTAGVPAGPDRDASLLFGTDVAMEVVASREADGANTNIPYIPSEAPGQWRRTPPYYRPPLTPQWGRVTPFGIPDAVRFRPPPPLALNSPEYAEAVNQVRALGAKQSAVRTPDQTEVARFWSDFSYTAMPPGHFHEVAMTISQNEGLSVVENARLFGLLGITQADAAIVCWETKYHYNYWRPVTAIWRADEDNNPDTEADPAWEPLLPAPPFPEYPSGHSTFSRAGATVLAFFFGRDELTFTARSDTLPGVERTFTSLSACADEVGMSRIYGGIHYMFSNLAGKRAGAAVAEYVTHNYLLRTEELPCLMLDRATPGQLRFRLHGWPGVRYAIEAAPDFKQWTRLTETEARVGGTEFEVDTQVGAPAGFYRAVELGAP